MATKEAVLDTALLLDFYRQMVTIRRLEEKAAELYTQGKIGGFLHLYIGEEAVAVGVISALSPQDQIVTHYRDHGHAIARGVDPKVIMAELCGKVTGSSKGKGGSMHLFDASKNFFGGYAIVGGMLPIAVGLGLASQYRGEDRLALCIFGDGAVNQGEFWESLNLAALWKLPVLFLLENNGYGMGTAVERATALKEIHKAAEVYGIPSAVVDGMDVLAVREAAQKAVTYIRETGGPFFLEAICYRFRGHSMADPLEYRGKAEEERWRRRDPINSFRHKMESQKKVTSAEFAQIDQEVEKAIEEAVQFAEESPFPPAEALYDNIYAP
jgi:pyruvate dehydrogenase E1 component alpha subunit